MKTVVKIYGLIAFLMLLDWTLFYLSGISFSGSIMDQMLFWCWFAVTFYIIFRFRKVLWVKIYTGFLTVLLLISILPMGIPLIKLQHFALGKEKSFRTKNFRIMQTSKNPLARPYISINRIYGFFEREIANLDDRFETGTCIYRWNNVLQVKERTTGEKTQLVFIFKTDTLYHSIP